MNSAVRAPARVAIVGGGFSGAMVLANLVELAQAPVQVEWFEASETPGLGVAYGTPDAAHLLNVRADKMGARAGVPDDFFRWLQTTPGKEQAEKIRPGQTFDAESYVPRMLYGEYLRALVEETMEKARRKDISVQIRHAPVVDAALRDADSQQVTLTTERGGVKQEMLADAVVLATGNLPPRRFAFQWGLIRGKADYVGNVWKANDAQAYPGRVHELPADAEVVIIGTGLTMVDTILTLRARGYKGTITAISRHGLLPASHLHGKPYGAWDWVNRPQAAPASAFGLLRRIRREVRAAAQGGVDWRAVVDSIRPVTQQLWKQLPTREKRKFLDRLFTFWNIHRHRMAPELHAELRTMQQSGALKIIAGRIYYVGSDEDGLTVAYRRRGLNRVETIRSPLVINCTGPEYDIAASEHKLLRNLRDRELVTVGPLRIGIEATASGGAKGRAQDAIFPIGTLLVGELLECTAVPELREQSRQVAERLVTWLGVVGKRSNADTSLLMAAL